MILVSRLQNDRRAINELSYQVRPDINIVQNDTSLS